MRTGPNCGSDRQRVVRRAGCSCALSATDRRADRRRDALAPGKECLQPVEHESGLLFDDPVSGVVNCLDLEVTHAIGIAAQQRRGDHWVSGSTSSATQLQKGPLNCCFTVEAIGTYSNLASLRETYSDLRKRIHGSPMRPRLLRNQGPPPRSKRFLTACDVAEIVQKYESGNTTQEIGARYGISKTRVATVLREQGITIRRQGLTEEQANEATGLYIDGRSLAWLGARYRVSHTTVVTALRRQGIPLRPRPGWT
jgi:hypothetical protein